LDTRDSGPPERAVIVGQNPDPFAFVSGANIFSSEEERERAAVIQSLQLSADGVKVSSGDPAGDVFEKNESWAAFANDADKMRDRAVSIVPGAFVVIAGAFSGEGVGLAGRGGCEEIQFSTQRAAVEGGNIIPHRRWSQKVLLHRFSQDFDSEKFPLHVHECSRMETCQSESEFVSADSGEQAGRNEFGM